MKTYSNGPWKIENRPNGMTYIISADGKMVARAIAGDSESVTYNEKLISAAPELLEAVVSTLNVALGDNNVYLPTETLERLKEVYRLAIGAHYGY